jgi:hypothetical protein
MFRRGAKPRENPNDDPNELQGHPRDPIFPGVAAAPPGDETHRKDFQNFGGATDSRFIARAIPPRPDDPHRGRLDHGPPEDGGHGVIAADHWGQVERPMQIAQPVDHREEEDQVSGDGF